MVLAKCASQSIHPMAGHENSYASLTQLARRPNANEAGFFFVLVFGPPLAMLRGLHLALHSEIIPQGNERHQTYVGHMRISTLHNVLWLWHQLLVLLKALALQSQRPRVRVQLPV